MVKDVLPLGPRYHALGSRIATALRHAQDTDFSEWADGEYPIDGTAVRALVQRDVHSFDGRRVLVPRGTPAAIVQRLNREINAVLQTPEMTERMASRGAEVVGGTPQQFAALIKSETGKYAKLLKQVGMAGSVSR